MDNSFVGFIEKYSRTIIGGICGFVFGFFLIQYGFLKTIILFLCIIVGIFVANRLKKVNIRKLLIEILSKGEDD